MMMLQNSHILKRSVVISYLAARAPPNYSFNVQASLNNNFTKWMGRKGIIE